MKKLLISVLLSCSLSAVAQVAIINDPDGYTNVRMKPDGQSPIVHRIRENEVFWYYEEGARQSEWIPVFITENRFSFGCTGLVEGFIHKSRLRPLQNLTKYQGKDFTFRYALAPFDTTGLVLNKVDSKYLSNINGRHFWGTDGDYPKITVKAMTVTMNRQPVDIHEIFYSDIFECSNDFHVYQNKGTYFVQQHNSDGAGGYEIVWVFANNKLKQRLVGSIY